MKNIQLEKWLKSGYFFLDKTSVSNLEFKKIIKKNRIKFPVVIKPNNEGSSIGVKICRTFALLKKQFNKLRKVTKFKR